MEAPRMFNKIAAIFVLMLLPWASLSADLVLNIDLATQEFDWENGTSINQLVDTIPDNRFGNYVTNETSISSPLPAYVGSGTHSAVTFDFSDDGLGLEGVGFSTSNPPGYPASFSGTADLPSNATFSLGDFSDFANLVPGSFDFAPMSANWDGVVTVNIISGDVNTETTAIPSLSAWGLVILSLLMALTAFTVRHRKMD
jgi:hypothetical protein